MKANAIPGIEDETPDPSDAKGPPCESSDTQGKPEASANATTSPSAKNK